MYLTYNAEMFKKTFESEFTWLNGFMRNVHRFGYKTAAIDQATEKVWSYSELNNDANKLANAMKKDGVKKNDVVFVQLFNSPQFLFGYIASQKIGAIINPANFNLSPGETAEIIGHNEPKVYIYDIEIVDTAVKALELSKHKPDIVIAVNNSLKEINLPEGHILFDDYVKDSLTEDPPIDFEPYIYDEVVRLQTSGPRARRARAAFRPRRYYAFSAQFAGCNNEYVSLVPPWRTSFRRSYANTFCRSSTRYFKNI